MSKFNKYLEEPANITKVYIVIGKGVFDNEEISKVFLKEADAEEFKKTSRAYRIEPWDVE